MKANSPRGFSMVENRRGRSEATQGSAAARVAAAALHAKTEARLRARVGTRAARHLLLGI